MGVQGRINLDTRPFWLSGNTVHKDSEVIKQDGSRTTPLLTNTLMAQIAADKKWVPFTNEAATDGTAIAKGIYVGDEIAAATIVAGDVSDVPVVIGGAMSTFDNGQLVIENSKTLDTVVGSGTLAAHRVEDDINRIGLFAEYTTDISEYENA